MGTGEGVARGVGEYVRTDDPQHALAEPALGGSFPDGAFDQGPQPSQRVRGQREGVTGHRPTLGAPHTTQVRGEEQRLGRLIEIGLAAQAGVQLGSVAGEDGELQAEGGLDSLEAGPGSL